MVQFDNQYRQVKLKVVYYGTGLSGKTTCLQYIHRVTDPQRRTKLYTLNTASDRTLFFDLLALELGRVRGYRLTLQLYTVPGQVQYNATRRAVLAGCDGVVFVADSQRAQGQANTESLENLYENLRANGIDPEAIPIVLEYNKRDLPDVHSHEELDALVNSKKYPSFDTVATTGVGVLEAFAAVTEATVLSMADRLGLAGQSETLTRLMANVKAAFEPLVKEGAQRPVEAPVVFRPTTDSVTLREDELVAEAVRANEAMTSLNAQLDRLTTELERRVTNMRAINDFGRVMAVAHQPEEITTRFIERLLADLRVFCGSLLLVDAHGELVDVLRRGLASEPLGRSDAGEQAPAAVILATRQPFLAQLDEMESTQFAGAPWLEELRSLNLVSFMAIPLIAQDQAVGVVTAYADERRGAFADEDLELASAMGANAAVALANARSWRTLEQLNRSLERTVTERTKEVERGLERAHALAGELEERNAALQIANRQLRDLEQLKGDLLNRIAHELNTPVTAIQTAARILGRYDEVPAGKAIKFVGIISDEASRLGELISSALQAAVLGVAEGSPNVAAVPLADLLRRVLASLRSDIAERKLKVQVKVAAGLDEITGDATQLEAALRAIIKNGVEFNHENGSLVITVRPLRRGGSMHVEVKVEDAGIGIPAEDLPHIFDLFWQGGKVLTGKPRGLGLGLTVARRVAENHGGKLEVSSEQGKGTVVTMELPIAALPVA
jgi:signal transduction histidine kinase/signal recognition particle receptor subunit beta